MRGTACRRRSSPREHPLPWSVLTVVLVVAGVLVAPPRPEPVTDPWGYVPTLGEEPRQAWALPGSFERLWVFTRAVAAAGPGGITALAPGSGRELWTIEADDPWCTSDGVQLTCVTSTDLVQTIDPRTGSSEDWTVPTVVAAAAAPGGDLVAATGRVLAPGGGRPAVAPARDGLWLAKHADVTRLYSRGENFRSVRGSVSWLVTAAEPGDIRELEPEEDRRWRPFAFGPNATLGVEASQAHGAGELIAREPDSRTERWRLPEFLTFDAPLLGPHTLLYSDSTQLRAVDLDTGRPTWTIDPEAAILDFTSDGDQLYVLAESGISTWTW